MPGMDYSSNITNSGNVRYEGKDSLLGRKLSGFMKRARNTYCREDASRVQQVTLQETCFLSLLHLFRDFRLFSMHQIIFTISLKVVHIPCIAQAYLSNVILKKIKSVLVCSQGGPLPLPGPLQDKRQQQGLCDSNKREVEGTPSAQSWSYLFLTTKQPDTVGVISTPPFFNRRVATVPRSCYAHGPRLLCLPRRWQSGPGARGGRAAGGGQWGGSGCAAGARGRLRPRLPSIGRGAPASPGAHHVCCSLARTSRATINKCTGRGPAPTPEQLPQRPPRSLPRGHLLAAREGRRDFSLSFLVFGGFFLRAAGLPGHATGLEQRCSCPPGPSRMSEIENPK